MSTGLVIPTQFIITSYLFDSNLSYSSITKDDSGNKFFNISLFFEFLENNIKSQFLSFARNEIRLFPICPVDPKIAILFKIFQHNSSLSSRIKVISLNSQKFFKRNITNYPKQVNNKDVNSKLKTIYKKKGPLLIDVRVNPKSRSSSKHY